jgi:putative aminopeptidase FrvX
VTKDSVAFLDALMSAPSPSGFEQPVQRVVRERVASFADDVCTDLQGNVIAVKNPGGAPRVMLAGHCDQIGFMVQHITAEGYLKVASIGGVDPVVMAGMTVVVHGAKGPVSGVVGRKPVHLMTGDERGKIDLDSLFIDIGAKDKKDAEKHVEVGECATFPLGMNRLMGDRVSGAGFDDKVGSFVVMEVLRLLKDRKIKCALYSVSTVQEELGLRGACTSAFGIEPLVGIAVDVTHATDYPGVDAAKMGEIKLGAGPTIARGPNINPEVGRLLKDTATARKIPFQVEPAPRSTGTDANAMQVSRAGVAAALVSIPNRYMHTPVEVCSLKDLENAAKLIAESVARIDEKMDFIPR